MTRATSYGVAIAGALVLIGLGYWFATNFAQLSRSILPGMASSPSQSMEPYEVVLKFDISRSEGNKDQQVNTSPAEWRLKLPRAFIWSELGTNDSIGGGLNHRLHSLDIYATHASESGQFSPSVFFDAEKNRNDGLFFFLSNGAVGGKLAHTGQCVRDDEIDAFFRVPKLSSRNCKDSKCGAAVPCIHALQGLGCTLEYAEEILFWRLSKELRRGDCDVAKIHRWRD